MHATPGPAVISPWTSAEFPEENLHMTRSRSASSAACANQLLLLVVLALSACSRQTALVTVREVGGGDHCPLSGAVSITDMNGLRRALGSDPGPVHIDFAKERVVVVSAGEKPTAGFRLQLSAPQARLEGGEVRVRLEELKPSGDAMVTQVLTRPCVALALSGFAFDAVDFVDDHGRSFAKTVIKENASP